MSNCKRCNREINSETSSKKRLQSVKYCDACMKKRKKEYSSKFDAEYQRVKKSKRKRAVVYDMAVVLPWEAHKVLDWLENAYFEKYGKRFNCVDHFGTGW